MSFLKRIEVLSGKHADAQETGKCYNCDKYVGSTNLVVNESTRWPVCPDCDVELEHDNADDDNDGGW